MNFFTIIISLFFQILLLSPHILSAITETPGSNFAIDRQETIKILRESWKFKIEESLRLRILREKASLEAKKYSKRQKEIAYLKDSFLVSATIFAARNCLKKDRSLLKNEAQEVRLR